jgi:PAAR motif
MLRTMPAMPAARIKDQTTHGSPLLPGPGSPNTLIGGLPAWRTNIDQHACPATSISGADGVGCVIVGSINVFINMQMACRVLDIVVEKPGSAMGPVNPIAVGCPTVIIGETPWAAGPAAAMPSASAIPSTRTAAATNLASMQAASIAAAQAPKAPSTPQSLALKAAAAEGTPLVEHCPYGHH